MNAPVADEGARGELTPAHRLAVAVALALAAGVLALALHSRPGFWPDYVLPWEGARLLLAGRDPYVALPGGLPEPFDSPLLYPLTTVVAAAPLAAFPMVVASAITMAISTVLLAWDSPPGSGNPCGSSPAPPSPWRSIWANGRPWW